MKAIDICCGAGGWACAARGLDGPRITARRARCGPIEIVAAYDHWDLACQTYRLNHPGTEVHQVDLTEGIDELVERHAGVDIILGGIPCQWLSAYRRISKPKPEEIREGRRLVDACLAIVAAIKPRWWCFENVQGMAKELPLDIPRQLINAREFSGQRRQRLYAGVFPHVAPQNDQRTSGDYHRRGPFRVGVVALTRELKTHRTFSDKASIMGVEGQHKGHTVVGQSSRHDAEIVVADPTIAGGRRAWEWQELAELQGFPDDYVFVGPPGHVMQMVGNAVQIDTARAILQSMIEGSRRCR